MIADRDQVIADVEPNGVAHSAHTCCPVVSWEFHPTHFVFQLPTPAACSKWLCCSLECFVLGIDYGVASPQVS